MVTGTVQAPWTGVCRRCTSRSAASWRSGCGSGSPTRRHTATPTDEEAYPIVDDELDLGPLVHDASCSSSPWPRCAGGLPGLCPHCGADRNEEQCGCVAPARPPVG